MNLETLSSFALARMLNECAEGSAIQRAIQEELRNREEHMKDNKTPWLFNNEERAATRNYQRPRTK